MNLELNYFKSSSESNRPPLLFIHGMAHGAWCWEKYFAPFFKEASFDCYTLSLRGHAGSHTEQNKRFLRINEYVQDAEAALSLIPSPPILIGHSMGGFIAQKLALKKANIKAVITLSSIPHNGMLDGSLKIAKQYPWRFLKGNLILSTAPFSDDKAVTKKLVFSETIDEETLSYTFSKLEPESYLAYMDMLFLDLHKATKLNMPMLFLHGKNDFIVDEKALAKTAQLFEADFLSLPDIAHDMMLDTEWKTAATEILNFIKNNIDAN